MSKYGYAYFNKNGQLMEFIIDPSVRQGNTGINKIYVFWQDEEPFDYLALNWINTDLQEAEWSTPQVVSNSTDEVEFYVEPIQDYDPKFFSYNQKYTGYLITIPQTALQSEGNIALSLMAFEDTDEDGVYDENDQLVKWLGLISIYVEQTGARFQVPITQSEFWYLLYQVEHPVLANYYSKSESDAKYVQLSIAEGQAVYAHSGATQTPVLYGTTASGSAIVQRDSNGHVIVPETPVSDDDATSKKYVDNLVSTSISSVYRYKGSVTTYADLPNSDLTIGDVYNVEATGDNYAWNGTAWDQLGANIDLSVYYTKTESDAKYTTFTGNNTFSGNNAFSGTIAVPTPTLDGQAANKGYVDQEIASAELDGVTFDNTPILNSQNAVTSGGVYAAINNKLFLHNHLRFQYSPMEISLSIDIRITNSVLSNRGTKPSTLEDLGFVISNYIKSQQESGSLIITSACEVDATGTYIDGTGTYTITKFGWAPLPRTPYVIDSNSNTHDLSSQYQAAGTVTDYIAKLI